MKESPTPWVDVNEIKRAVSIEQVLAHYGVLERLKRRGNTLSGLSPFRDEKTPSFFVHTDGKWNDMAGRPIIEGKEVPGNVVGLVMAFESCGFREALLKLHDLAGLPATPRNAAVSVASAASQTRVKVDRVLSEKPAENEPFRKQLSGLRYDVPFLQKRGMSPEVARKWGVGFCSRGLHKGRIVVPIKNRAGEIVAYIGRSLQDDDPNGKWRLPNGFHRIELFGADRLAQDEETRAAVHAAGIIVVEGVFDAIHLVERGFKNTVSTLGADVTASQIALLEQLNPARRPITVFFDNDDAGRAGRKRLAGELIRHLPVRYVDFDRIDAGDRTDPDMFTADELKILLA